MMPKTVMMSGGATCPSQVSRRKIGSVRFVYSGNVTCQSFIIAWKDLPTIEKDDSLLEGVGGGNSFWNAQ